MSVVPPHASLHTHLQRFDGCSPLYVCKVRTLAFYLSKTDSSLCELNLLIGLRFRAIGYGSVANANPVATESSKPGCSTFWKLGI